MDNFDRKFKNRINNEFKDIPSSLDNKIEELLKCKKKSIRWKRNIAVAAIGCILISGSGISITSYATGRNIKDIIYSFIGFNDNYNKYSTGLNEAQSNEGIKITITRVVFDGYKVNISYEVEASEDKQHLLKDNKFNLQTNKLGNTTIKIGDKEISTSSGEYWKIDERGRQVGVLGYDMDEGAAFDISNNISNKFVGKNAKDFNIEIDINKNIDGKDAKWNFDIPMSNEKLKSSIKEYRVNKNEDGINLESIIVTPLSIYVKGNLNKDYEDFKIILEDKQGKEYKCVASGIKKNFGKSKFRIEFDNNIRSLEGVKVKAFFKGKELKELETKLNI